MLRWQDVIQEFKLWTFVDQEKMQLDIGSEPTL